MNQTMVVLPIQRNTSSSFDLRQKEQWSLEKKKKKIITFQILKTLDKKFC